MIHRRSALAYALTLSALVLSSSCLAQETRASYGPIPDEVWAFMQGRSLRPSLSCPARDELALMRLPYLDFEGRARLGSMIVAKRAAPQVAAIFEEIFASGRFRIERMSLVDAFDGDDDRSIAANNTSGFNCRTTDHGGLSRHALGLAIDVNPVQNPYVEGTLIAPPAAAEYAAPSARRPGVAGLITPGDVVTRAFARRGWRWGGAWRTIKDYQHFSLGGH